MDFILDFISDLLYGPFFDVAEWIWNWCINMCTGIIVTSPQEFSPDTWAYVRDVLYPWALSIGVSCVNLFFMIGFLKAISNLRENITLEMTVEALIRLVVANVLLQVGVRLVSSIFTMSSLLAGQVLTFEAPAFFTSEADLGSHLFWWLFGFLYFLIAVISAGLIFFTLYGRYIKLYLLLLFYPVAIPTLVAGRGMEATAYAWIKTFLSNTLEIVVIALVMSIAGRLIAGVQLPEAGFLEYFDGFAQAIHSALYMGLMAASVKGASSFMNRAFAL